jgi:hypothetical protein
VSYKTQLKVVNDKKFYDNAIRLATPEEAKNYGEHKLDTWSAAVEYQVVESDDPVNYRWDIVEGLVKV